jgi:hypothetical protein
MLKWILQKLVVRRWNGLSRLRKGEDGGVLWWRWRTFGYRQKNIWTDNLISSGEFCNWVLKLREQKGRYNSTKAYFSSWPTFTSPVIVDFGWDSHSGEDVDTGLRGCNTVWICRLIPTFRKNILSPSSVHTALQSRIPISTTSGNCLLRVFFTNTVLLNSEDDQLTCGCGLLDVTSAPVWGPAWRLRGATLASGGGNGGGNGGLIQDAAELALSVKTCKNRFKDGEKKKENKTKC